MYRHYMYLFHMFFLLLGVQESCYDGSVRIVDNYYSYQRSYAHGHLTNGTYFLIGYVEICSNGTYRTVCNQGLSTNVATALCRRGRGHNLGYPGALYGDESDFGFVESGDGIYNLSCPPSSHWNDYDCTYTVTYGNGCNDYNEPALITCLAGEYLKFLLYSLCLIWIFFLFISILLVFKFYIHVLFEGRMRR